MPNTLNLYTTQMIWMIFYENIAEYSPIKERKISINFDDMIAVMVSIKKLSPTVTELFIINMKSNISTAFITQCYFQAPKDVTLNWTHFFVKKTSAKEKLNKLHLIFHQILNLKTLWIFFKNVLQTIFFIIIRNLLEII